MKKYYCEKYDTFYNEHNQWRESTCDYAGCEFCTNRPALHDDNCSCLKHSRKTNKNLDKLFKEAKKSLGSHNKPLVTFTAFHNLMTEFFKYLEGKK